MERREFLERAGCGAAGFAAAPIAAKPSEDTETQDRPRYQYEIEIFEARDRREAEEIARSSPIVEDGLGSWMLRRWTELDLD